MGGHGLYARCDGQRAEGSVRRGGNLPALRHGGDLLQFPQSAHDRNVRHDDVHQSLVQDGPEPLPVHQTLASGQRHVDVILDGQVALVVFVGHGFLVPVQVQVTQCVEDLAPAPCGEVAVAVDQQGYVGTDRGAHRLHAGDALPGVRSPVDAGRHPVEGRELYRVKSIRDRGGRVPGESRGRPVRGGPVDVGVEGDLVAAASPDEVGHRYAQELSLDIPQGLVEGAERHHFRPVHRRRKEFGQDAFDGAGVAAGKHRFGLLQEVHAPGSCAPWIHLAVSGDPFVGMHRQERPVAAVVHVDGMGLQPGYLHGLPSGSPRLTLHSVIDRGNAFVYITPCLERLWRFGQGGGRHLGRGSCVRQRIESKKGVA